MARSIKGIFDGIIPDAYAEHGKFEFTVLNGEYRLPVIINRSRIVSIVPCLDDRGRLTGDSEVIIEGYRDPILLSNSEADRMAKWLCMTR